MHPTTKPDESMATRLVLAGDEPGLDQVRRLLEEGAAEFGPLVAGIFVVQGFAAELAGLPGRYAAPGGCLLLATVGETPVGCVALRDLGDATCEMKRLYVIPPGRKQGVGRILVGAVIHQAEQIGYRRMVLDTLPEMAAAIALYRQFGFALTAPYWSHPTAAAVFMERSLGDDPRSHPLGST